MDSSNLPAKNSLTGIVIEIQELLGPPPILKGENLETYNAFHARVRDAVDLTDFVEEILVCDFVDQSWDAQRLRRWKAKYHKFWNGAGFRALTKSMDDRERRRQLIEDFCGTEVAGLARAREFVAKTGSQDTLDALTLEVTLDSIERFDRLLARAEHTRNALLREIDRRRDAAASRRIKLADLNVQDAEVADV